MPKRKSSGPKQIPPEDYEIYHDSIGVMHFLPPKKEETPKE
jgi:hypothetical protein